MKTDPSAVINDCSSSNAAKITAAHQPHKLNSFAAALAKKGITLQNALHKKETGSVRKELYLADLNGHRLLCVVEGKFSLFIL